MKAKIHCILTGALESSYATSVYGAPERHPLVTKEELLPHGHKERVYLEDGSVEPGLMVPVPVWLIEDEGKRILIDTGLGDCAEIMEMQVETRTAEQAALDYRIRHLDAGGIRL